MQEVLIEAVERLKRNERFALVTVTRTEGSTPRKEGSRMIVEPSGTISGTIGGGAVERIAIEKALSTFKSGKVIRVELDLDDVEQQTSGMVCGGRMELMVEPFGSEPRLHLFGAGHVAHATAGITAGLGFALNIYDSRRKWASVERFPRMNIHVGETGLLAQELESSEDDYILVMTHSHDEDFGIVKNLLRKSYYYLGVIGSRRKSAEIRQRLTGEDFTSAEIERMTCPIGLDIGSHTPQEIAVAVAAQLIQLRNAGTGK